MRRGTLPIKFKQANDSIPNTICAGRLPVYHVGDTVTACWRIPFWRRFSVLRTGRVYLTARAEAHLLLHIETEIYE